jgi:archaellum biogenesis ATPase FlaH
MTSLQTKFDGGYPTVSVPSGEDVSGIKPNLEYISSFGEIYIIADQDKQGALFQEAICKLLPVGKVRLVKLPKGIKDPSDMWKACKSDRQRNRAAKALYNSLFSAEKYSPAGIMSLSEGWGAYLNRGKDPLILFPDSFGDLNHKTFGGYALGEIVNIIAPSSVGKSSFVKEMIYTALETTNYNVGVIAVEETIDEFIEGLLSIHMSTQLNELSDDQRDFGAEFKEFQELCKLRPDEYKTEGVEDAERIQFLDHQGACSGEELLEKINFLIHGLDCKIIILDPVTLAFSGHDTDEDEMASEIVKIVKRNKVAWINVHHVRKNSSGGTANSEGGDLAEEDIKGTGAWFQTGMINLIFTRNKVHENPVIRNTTRVKMSKCRRHGKSTGICGWIYYDGVTGRLHLGQDPAELEGGDTAGAEDDMPAGGNAWES